MAKYQLWDLKSCDPELIKKLSKEINVNPLIVELLIKRGVDTTEKIKRFLQSDLANLHDPFLFSEMPKALERLDKAKDNNEPVLIYGDYDVDGITSTVILLEYFRNLGMNVDFTMPLRLIDGYGLNQEKITEAHEKGVKLIVTVDCGINSKSEVDFANSLGIDIIITDHHIPEVELPSAVAVINSHCHGYPFPDLAGVGVAYKLIQAYHTHLGNDGFPAGLDMAALGTISDIVPLLGENRNIVIAGLHELRTRPRIGMQSLLEVSNTIAEELDSHSISYRIAPRLNAIGRLGDAQEAITLLTTRDRSEAEQLANQLEDHNRDRRTLQDQHLNEVLDRLRSDPGFMESKTFVFAEKGWHRGVLGIVAARLVDMYHRPVILLAIENGKAIGSCRSIEGFNIVEALEACRECLEGFGGHEMAAGLQLDADKIESFISEFTEYAEKNIPPVKLESSLKLDAVVPLSSWEEDLYDQINILEPWGTDNPQPVFMAREITASDNPRIVGNNHLKLVLREKNKVYNGIAFSQGNLIEEIDLNMVDIAYTPILNRFGGREYIEMKIVDMKPSVSNKVNVDNNLEKAKRKMKEFLSKQPPLPSDKNVHSEKTESVEPIFENVIDKRNLEDRIDDLAMIFDKEIKTVILADKKENKNAVENVLIPLLERSMDSTKLNLQDFESFLSGMIPVYIASYREVAKLDLSDVDILVVYDLPEDNSSFPKLINKIKISPEIAEVHLLYGSIDLDLDGKILPEEPVTREVLGDIYRKIREKATETGIPQSVWGEFIHDNKDVEDVIAWALTIFSELGLLSCESDGTIRILPAKDKKDLEESPTYKKLLSSQTYLEKVLAPISYWGNIF